MNHCCRLRYRGRCGAGVRLVSRGERRSRQTLLPAEMEPTLTPLPLPLALPVVTNRFPVVVLLASAKLFESAVVQESVLAAAVTLETDGSHAPLSFEGALYAHVGISSTASANPRLQRCVSSAYPKPVRSERGDRENS